MQVPCFDCIGGVNPYDPSKWAYVVKTPTNSSDVQSCSVGGDFNLGTVANICESYAHPPSPPVSVKGVPYLLFQRDCLDNLGYASCAGKTYFEFPPCDNPASSNSYGDCSMLKTDAHYWFVRDWATELKDPMSQIGCCVYPEGASSRTSECPPSLWSGGSRCGPIMGNFCNPLTWNASLDVNGTTIPEICDTFVQQSLLNTTSGVGNQLFIDTLREWSAINAPKINPKDPFLPYVVKWCSGQGSPLGPQLQCSSYLEQVCANVTRTDILNDTTGNLGKLCGCYVTTVMPGIIPQECDALCSLQPALGGIPLFESSSSPVVKTCQQTSCIIDDVAINFINSSGGDINFGQVCSGCPSGGCTCIYNGVTEEFVNSQVGNLNFGQNCAQCSGDGCPPPTPPPSATPMWMFAVAIGVLLLVIALAFVL